MEKEFNVGVDENLRKKRESFANKMESEMYFKSNVSSDSMSFDWVDEFEFACPYIDNIIKKPKMALIKEEDVVKIEKAKKITVASVKDLSRHTHYIEKIDRKTNEVKPSKILIIRNEETFNIYENRFIYTLIDNLTRFIMRKEAILEEFSTEKNKTLEYVASTFTENEKISIELKINSDELPKNSGDNEFSKEIEEIKVRLRKIKDYISGWKRSEFMKALDKEHVSFVTSPIKKTNMILKNPNFQIAMKLWTFLQTYDMNDRENTKEGLDTSGNDILKGFLDHSFLIDYCVLDSVSRTKREQKEKLAEYAILMLTEEIHRIISLLLSSGIKITDEQLLSMIANEMKQERNNRLVGIDDVKKKFKNAMNEYLERTQDYL